MFRCSRCGVEMHAPADGNNDNILCVQCGESNQESATDFAELIRQKRERQRDIDLRSKIVSARSQSTSSNEDESPAEAKGEQLPQRTTQFVAPFIDSHGDLRQQQGECPSAKLRHYFADPTVTGVALRIVAQHVQRHLGDATNSIACPRHLSCNVPDCPSAFDCGVLRHRGTSWGSILFWSCISGLVMFVCLVFALGLTFATVPADERQELNLFAGGLGVAGLCLAAMLVGFTFAFLRRLRKTHRVRALAQLANDSGLTFVDELKLPIEWGTSAFPIVHPGEPGVCRVELSGKVNEQAVQIVDFCYSVRPFDDIPGAAPMRLLGKVSRRQSNDIYSYLVMCLTDQLVNVPDFIVTPKRTRQYLYVKKALRNVEVTQLLRFPRVGRRYSVHSLAPGECVHLFDRQLCEFLEQNPDWYIQVVAGRLHVWHHLWEPTFAFREAGLGERLTRDLETALWIRENLTLRAAAM